jgi:hypothetical protein
LEAFEELIRRLIRCLSSSSLDYAFTGALAVSFYGSPRTTSDVDLIIAISSELKETEVADALWCAGLEVEERKLNEAITSGYNIATFRDKTSPYSVDIIITRGRLDKRPGAVAGLNTYLQKPEALISAKLRMIKATLPRERAVKDEEDIRGILAFTKVDMESVKKMAEREGTLDILQRLTESTTHS